MSAGPTIPASLENITPEWLTSALRTAGQLPHGDVISYETEVIGAGVGFIGALGRLSLNYDGAPADAPRSVIAKLPATDPGSRALGVMFGLYEREVRFYQQFASIAGMTVPACYHADYDANGSAILLMEDLQGGRFGDQVSGSTPDEARLAIRHLSAFHARWWQSPRVADFPWIAPGESIVRGPVEMMYDACWPTFQARFAHLLSPAFHDLLPTLGRRTLKAMDTFFESPRTVCQGDYRPDNLFYGEPGTPSELVVCDWQIINYSPGIVDLAYVVTGSLSVDDRRRHEDELLREYHAGLMEGGVTNYTLEQLHLDHRAYFAGVIAAGVVLGATLPDANERGKALLEVTFERFMAAIDDLDSLSLLPEP